MIRLQIVLYAVKRHRYIGFLSYIKTTRGVTSPVNTLPLKRLSRYAYGYDLPAICAVARCDHSRHLEAFGFHSSPPSFMNLLRSDFSIRPRGMDRFRLVLLSISSVSALVLNPDLLLISPPSTTPGNASMSSNGPPTLKNVRCAEGFSSAYKCDASINIDGQSPTRMEV